MSKPKIFLCDMDSTIVDWEGLAIPLLRSLESPQEKGLYNYDDLNWTEKTFPIVRERLHLIMSKQGFWTSLNPILPGIQLYNMAKEMGYECYILTKARNNCSLAWKEKVDWIHQYLGRDENIMVVTEKKLVHGDILFDDFPKNMNKWLDWQTGYGIMPLRSWNADYRHERAYVWDEQDSKVFDILKEIRNKS